MIIKRILACAFWFRRHSKYYQDKAIDAQSLPTLIPLGDQLLILAIALGVNLLELQLFFGNFITVCIFLCFLLFRCYLFCMTLTCPFVLVFWDIHYSWKIWLITRKKAYNVKPWFWNLTTLCTRENEIRLCQKCINFDNFIHFIWILVGILTPDLLPIPPNQAHDNFIFIILDWIKIIVAQKYIVYHILCILKNKDKRYLKEPFSIY